MAQAFCVTKNAIKVLGVSVRLTATGILLLLSVIVPLEPIYAKNTANTEVSTRVSVTEITEVPLVIQLQLPNKTEAEIALEQQKAQRQEEHKQNVLDLSVRQQEVLEGQYQLGYFQIGLFILQLIVLAYQAYQMRSTLKITAKSADAASLSAKTLVGVELPILYIRPPELIATDALIDEESFYGGFISYDAPTQFSAIGGFTLINSGRTSACINEFKLGWMVAETLPEKPVYEKITRLNDGYMVAPNGEQYIDEHASIFIADEHIENLKSEEVWLWVYCTVSYSDFLSIKREKKFCWRFANRNSKSEDPCFTFESDGMPPLSYLGEYEVE